MTLDLDELESKAKAATPGPWKCVAHVERLLLGVQSADGVPISVIAGDRPLTDMRQAIADNYYIAAACNSVPALIARIRELEERDTELSDAAAQVLDDMGKKGLNCCGAAKAELRAALGEWPDLDFTLADAQAIIDACDYRKGTPNGTS
jgi:hypothetical protein